MPHGGVCFTPTRPDDDFSADGEGVYPENKLSADEGKGAQLMKSALLGTHTRAAAELLLFGTGMMP